MKPTLSTLVALFATVLLLACLPTPASADVSLSVQVQNCTAVCSGDMEDLLIRGTNTNIEVRSGLIQGNTFNAQFTAYADTKNCQDGKSSVALITYMDTVDNGIYVELDDPQGNTVATVTLEDEKSAGVIRALLSSLMQ